MGKARLRERPVVYLRQGLRSALMGSPCNPYEISTQSLCFFHQNVLEIYKQHRCCATLARRIVVKTAAGFTAEPTGGDVAPQQDGGTVLGIAESPVVDIANGEKGVQSNEIGKG